MPLAEIDVERAPATNWSAEDECRAGDAPSDALSDPYGTEPFASVMTARWPD